MKHYPRRRARTTEEIRGRRMINAREAITGAKNTLISPRLSPMVTTLIPV
jgi:hypothetical protein